MLRRNRQARSEDWRSESSWISTQPRRRTEIPSQLMTRRVWWIKRWRSRWRQHEQNGLEDCEATEVSEIARE